MYYWAHIYAGVRGSGSKAFEAQKAMSDTLQFLFRVYGLGFLEVLEV